MTNTDHVHHINMRSYGRERALQMTYSWEQNRFEPGVCLLTSDAEEDAEGVSFADRIFSGLCSERVVIDQEIEARLTNWKLSRLAVVDRALLRLGVYELLYRRETPSTVVINEYIELARLYGSDEKTTMLVNGLLDRVARKNRPDECAGGFDKPLPFPTPSGGVPVLPG